MAREGEPVAAASLTELLRPHPDPDGTPDVFVAQSEKQPWGRVFGGQVLGQSVVAAGRTVAPNRLVHSLHAYFLRPGDDSAPIRLTVERLRDGRSFSARRVHALQSGGAILSMIASFQTPAAGVDHQSPAPDVPAFEDMPSASDVLPDVEHSVIEHWRSGRPVDIRHVEPAIYLRPAPARVAEQAVWLRLRQTLPDDPLLHAAALAFISDYTVLEPTLRRHGLSWATPGAKASLDHAMWWHREARADQALLYAVQSPSASGARGLSIGRIYTAEGVLVASVAQEGMIRSMP